MNQTIHPFHLAIPVDDLHAARHFYGQVLQCREGRTDELWTDYDFYGHQLVIHYKPKGPEETHHNPVDGHDVPVPHFGVVLPWDEWEKLVDRVRAAGVSFVIEPYIRFAGQTGEQATVFFMDPCGNALEFKAFKDIGQLFAK
ncbi:MAG: VOC family protein [Saprospiraceae bacterium]|nr:VOC family protein [Saprospiraceae bacterium]